MLAWWENMSVLIGYYVWWISGLSLLIMSVHLYRKLNPDKNIWLGPALLAIYMPVIVVLLLVFVS